MRYKKVKSKDLMDEIYSKFKTYLIIKAYNIYCRPLLATFTITAFSTFFPPTKS